MSDTIAQNSYLPWLRQGLSTQMEASTDALRSSLTAIPDPEIRLSLQLHASRRGEQEASAKNLDIDKRVRLYGPGDIIGIEKRAIIKTMPAHGEQFFEENYLPYIEFYEEDFPWRYTPLLPDGNRLRPWLALIVLKEDEFERDPRDTSRHLSSIVLQENVPLPPADQLWGWAHVQVNKNIDQAELQDTITASPHLAASRIICPRRLQPLTGYYAFLVPAFEKGRLAGLGAPAELIDQAPLQLAAWNHPAEYGEGLTSFQNRMPIYQEWTFRTANQGDDIETLARKLEPRQLDLNIGKRLVDMQAPGYNLRYQGHQEGEYGVLPAYGALHHPDARPSNLLEDDSAEAQEFLDGLQGLLNLEEDLRDPEQELPDPQFRINPYFEDDADPIEDDPIITPPIYGALHANVLKVERQNQAQDIEEQSPEGWLEQLNLDPRNRMAAGLGAEVIRRNQERFMNEAWDQYEELFEVNSHLRRTQFVLELKKALYAKHLDTTNPVRRLQMRAPLSTSVSLDGHLMKSYVAGKLPAGLISSGYNKFVRPKGATMKRFFALANGDVMAQANGTLGIQLSGISTTAPAETSFPGDDIINPDVPDTDGGSTEFHEKLGEILDDYNGATGLENAAEKLKDYFLKSRDWYIPKPKELDLGQLLGNNGKLDAKLLPINATQSRLRKRIANLPSKVTDQTSETFLSPITAAPTFSEPMYEELMQVAFDNFVPNMDLVPPNTVGTLEPNRGFIESFMVGLNYEMARELFWREYPTDQRGTYFQHFWDSIDHDFDGEEQLDISPIHTWKSGSALGSHPGAGTEAGQLVMVIRGELFIRYPEMNIYLKRLDNKGKPLSDSRKLPVFKARVNPDLYFLGFNESEENVRDTDQNWHFVLEERPGEQNFGLDSIQHPPASNTTLDSWDDLNWLHLAEEIEDYINLESHVPPQVAGSTFKWGTQSPDGSSAHMAAILNQSPAKIYIKASELFLPL